MNRWRHTVLLCGLLGLWPSLGWCGWQSFSTVDGLAGSTVLCVFEDRDEDAWFGTSAGASRYDGFSWRTFRVGNGLAADTVRCIAQAPGGALWFGTARGASRFDHGLWHTFTSVDGLARDDVRAVVVDGAGVVWFGTAGGVSRFDGSSWRSFTSADSLPSDDVRALAIDPRGALWCATAAGVSRRDAAGWRVFTAADGLPSDDVRAVAAGVDSTVWFGTAAGASRFDGTAWRVFTTADGLASDRVASTFADRVGHVWCGSTNPGAGLSRYDGTRWRVYHASDGLADDGVLAIFQDHSGNRWFGTASGGVSRFDGVSWKSFTRTEGLAHSKVLALHQDRDGDLWFGTADGVSRYDGRTWRSFTVADGLASYEVRTIAEDGGGVMWFGTYGGGVSRFDGSMWTTYATGTPADSVWSSLVDRSGQLWFGSKGGGVRRFDGQTWTTYTTSNSGLAHDEVRWIIQDRADDLWFGTNGGASRWDGQSWTKYTTGDGLAHNEVRCIFEARDGALWFGTRTGVTRYDGTSWRTYRTADGLPDPQVRTVFQDRAGVFWFGTRGGLTRWDGEVWRTFLTVDGLAGNDLVTILEERAGDLWFATESGATRHEPDRVPPHTVLTLVPPGKSANSIATVAFAAAFGESRGIEFSYTLNGSSMWSAWSTSGSWSGALGDARHVFAVRARDGVNHVDATAATCHFEIDATPPAPVLASPAFGAVVRDSVPVRGTAADARFLAYRIDARPFGATSWEAPPAMLVVESAAPRSESLLGVWPTAALTDGEYELRLAVRDSLGLTGGVLVRVTVDNQAPHVGQTAPVLVHASEGGHVFTTRGDVHLYFPPGGLEHDAVVSIAPLDSITAPAILASGAVRLGTGYDISWNPGALRKPATLEWSYTATASDPVIYVFDSGAQARRVGGSVDTGAHQVSSALHAPGGYALYLESGSPPTGTGDLSALSLTPRVFAPRGGFANTEVAIGFTLGEAGPVTVKVYNRAGRLVREVASGRTMNVGANLVRWDGRDAGGETVRDGLYLVEVEARGRKQTRTVSVVR